MSTASDRFPRFEEIKRAENSPEGSILCRLRRVISPPSGSTLMTSAPWSARTSSPTARKRRSSGRARERHGADQPSLPYNVLKWYCREKDAAGNVSLPAGAKTFQCRERTRWASEFGQPLFPKRCTHVSAGAHETRRRLVRDTKIASRLDSTRWSPPVIIRRGT